MPWPHIHAEDISLGNPQDVPVDYTARLKRIEASIAPLALLHREVYLPRITLVSLDASLKRLENGKNNWTFNLANSDEKDSQKPVSPWSFQVDDIVFDRGKIDYQDAVAKAGIYLMVNQLGKPVAFAELTGSGDDKQAAAKNDNNYIFGWKAEGTYNN